MYFSKIVDFYHQIYFKHWYYIIASCFIFWLTVLFGNTCFLVKHMMEIIYAVTCRQKALIMSPIIFSFRMLKEHLCLNINGDPQLSLLNRKSLITSWRAHLRPWCINPKKNTTIYDSSLERPHVEHKQQTSFKIFKGISPLISQQTQMIEP